MGLLVKTRRSNAYFVATMVAIMGTFTSVVVWRVFHQGHTQIRATEFQLLANERSESIKREIDDNIELLYSISSFYAGSDHVDCNDFAIYAAPLMRRNQSALAFEWVPRVTEQERRGFEERLSQQHGRYITISEVGSHQHLRTAGQRDVYFPVEYLVQQGDRPSSAIGFDHSSESARWNAMQKAARTGQPTASVQLSLFKLIDGAEAKRTGVFIAMPVYDKSVISLSDEPNQDNLLGYIVGLFRVADVIDNALAHMAASDVDLVLYDSDAEMGRQLLYTDVAASDWQVDAPDFVDRFRRASAGIFEEYSLPMNGRDWTLLMAPGPGFYAPRQSWIPTALLLSALLATATLAVAVFLLLERAAKVERVVKQRTDELQLANRSLRISESRIRSILETAGDSIITIDETGRLMTMNPAAEKMFSYTLDQVIGQHVSKIMPAADQFQSDALVQSFGNRRSKTTSREAEAVGRRKDGSLFPIEMAVSSVFADGQCLMTGIIRDITQKKESAAALRAKAVQLSMANEVLEEKNRELDEFTYVASHDLQEPIRKLISFSKLLEQDLAGDLNENAQRDLHFIVDSAQRMRQLVQDLLALSRAGRSAMKNEVVSLKECVDDALSALHVRLEETNAKIICPDLPEVRGDGTLLTQLFQNLIGNAIKFVQDERPVVELTVAGDGSTWTVGVKDNGIGIREEHRERIFKPFQRLHSRSDYSGTGIGLAICRKTVQRHGGDIYVESVPDEGAHFLFTIPMCTSEEPTREDAGKASSPAVVAPDTSGLPDGAFPGAGPLPGLNPPGSQPPGSRLPGPGMSSST